MTLDEVRRAARDAIEHHASVARRVVESVEDPARRARLIGPFPRWAAYVLKLGEPGPASLVSREDALHRLGSVRAIRMFALRLLEVADELDPVVCPVEVSP